MPIFIRFPLGVACLAAGCAITLFGAWGLYVVAVAKVGHGLPYTFGCVIGIMMIGGAFDLFRGPRAPAAPIKEDIAKSIMATRAHVDQDGIGENAKAAHGDGGPYLGVFAGEGGPVPLRYEGPKHWLIFGPPGSSKSMGLCVPNLAHLRRSIIASCPKAQLSSITARLRATLGRLIVLNAFGLFVDQMPHLQSVGWNPVLQVDPKSHDFEGDALCLADALIDRSTGGGNNVFFENAAENLLTALIMWERYTKGDKASLRNIRAELCRPSLLDTLKLMAECDNYAISNAGGRLYARLTDPNSKATAVQDIIETVLSSTRFLDDPRIAYDMAHGGAIDFGALHREIVTIFLILPVHELTAQAKWLRMFVNLALRGLYKSPPTSGATLPPILLHAGRIRQPWTAARNRQGARRGP
jgi:type IV secretory pathway TraG/TraD family ATPase VirD4